jgi:hypothetical protein
MDAAGHAAPLRATEKATTPFVVGREAIEALRSVVVDDRTVSIGEVRDFREHPALAAFVPEAARPSFAWTRLAPGETHHAHTHPIASTILICSGGGRLVGDVTRPVSAGDAVCVPRRRKPRLRRGRPGHELPVDPVRGAGFEDGDAPRLRYADAGTKRYTRVVAEGRQRWRAPVVETINPLLADADAVGRFWSYVKRWSMRFQHLLYARQITVDFADPSYELFREHLREEFDHDSMIPAEPAPWDGELDAYEHWFEGETAKRTPVEKLIIVNGVLETAGEIFAREIRGVAPEMKGYIDLHDERDAGHAGLAANRIAEYVASRPEDALTIVERSWRVFIAMFERIPVKIE